LWALEVPGIVKAFAFRTNTSEVTVYPLQSLTSNRVPDSTKLTEVYSYISNQSRKPLCANIVSAAMTEKVLNITVLSISPDTTSIRSAVESSIGNYLLNAYPIQYPDDVNPTNVISLSSLYGEASSAGASIISMTMELVGGSGSIVNYTLNNNEIIKLGTVTWPT